MKICPSCNYYPLRESGGNALSRKDNKTIICDKCAQREALEEYIKWEKEQKEC